MIVCYRTLDEAGIQQIMVYRNPWVQTSKRTKYIFNNHKKMFLKLKK